MRAFPSFFEASCPPHQRSRSILPPQTSVVRLSTSPFISLPRTLSLAPARSGFQSIPNEPTLATGGEAAGTGEVRQASKRGVETPKGFRSLQGLHAEPSILTAVSICPTPSFSSFSRQDSPPTTQRQHAVRCLSTSPPARFRRPRPDGLALPLVKLASFLCLRVRSRQGCHASADLRARYTEEQDGGGDVSS